jgi:hypothetical protein
MAILLLSFFGQEQPIFDSAAAFEDEGILWRAIAFTLDFGGAKLEVLRNIGSACPLDTPFIIIGTCIFTSHDFDLVVTASIPTNTF